MTLSELIQRLKIIQSEVKGDPVIEHYDGLTGIGYNGNPFYEVKLLYHAKNKDGETVVRIE